MSSMVPGPVGLDRVGQVGEHAPEARQGRLVGVERDRGRARPALPGIGRSRRGDHGGEVAVVDVHPEGQEPGGDPLALVVVAGDALHLEEPARRRRTRRPRTSSWSSATTVALPRRSRRSRPLARAT